MNPLTDDSKHPRLAVWKGHAKVPKEVSAANLRAKIAEEKAEAKAAKWTQPTQEPKPVKLKKATEDVPTGVIPQTKKEGVIPQAKKEEVTEDVPRGRLGPPDLSSVQ